MSSTETEQEHYSVASYFSVERPVEGATTYVKPTLSAPEEPEAEETEEVADDEGDGEEPGLASSSA